VSWIVTAASLGLTTVTTAIAAHEWHGRRVERRHAVEGRVRRFHIDSERSRHKFYEATIDVVEQARVEIFKAGRGVSKFADPQDQTVARYTRAEERALERGVSLCRVQLAPHVSGGWATTIAELIERHPSQYRVFEDFSDRSFVNISVVDADSDNPIVEFLFDTPQRSVDGDRFVASEALIIEDNRALAQAVRELFLERIKLLRPMSAKDIRALGFDHLYFAYGANLDEAMMHKRAPSAEALGVACLEGWRLEFGVPGPHLDGGGAAITPEPDSKVWGLLYSISANDKYRLDVTERAAYEAQVLSVTLTPHGSSHEAQVYVPQASGLGATRVPPDHAYLKRMLAAAERWDIAPLQEQLQGLLCSD
jgi:Gamma-glutamyl cyclotransferase, AIG2-like